MIHERLAHLERMRHARAIDLGVDVADEISLEIEILDERQGMIGRSAPSVALEDLHRRVTLQLASQPVAEYFAPHVVAYEGNAVEVRVNRITRQGLERGLGPEDPRGPVGLGIERGHRSEQGP